MIDRARRDRLAFLIRQLASGRITNDEFEDTAFDEVLSGQTEAQSDPVLLDVLDEVWFFYGDLREYRLTGPDKLSRECRHALARFIVFLHSDAEYSWHPWWRAYYRARGGTPRFLFTIWLAITTALCLPRLTPLNGTASVVIATAIGGINWVIDRLHARELLRSAPGDFDAWPWLTTNELRAGAERPRLLAG